MTDDESGSGLGYELTDPNTWPLDMWAFVAVVSIPSALILFEDSELRNTSIHHVVIGIALVEVAVLTHFTIYPDMLLAGWDTAVALAYGVWSLLPTIPWEPWHVTTSMGGLVGPLFILNGLRGSVE